METMETKAATVATLERARERASRMQECKTHSQMKIIFVFQAAVHSVTQKIIFIEGEDLEAIKKATLLEFLEKLKEDEKVRCRLYSWI